MDVPRKVNMLLLEVVAAAVAAETVRVVSKLSDYHLCIDILLS